MDDESLRVNDDALRAAKAEARIAAQARRRFCDPGLGAGLAATLFAGWPPPPDAIVAGFWPIGDEIDIRPLMKALAARGHALCLPVTPKRGLPLAFRRWCFGEPLLPGRFGTSHPDGAIVVPDFLLIPLLAFDRKGRRLGYGAGYYDRTLEMLPAARKVGCAFAAQEMPVVPAGPADQRLDAVITETGLVRFDQGSMA